jgi:hypothetical protein
VAENEAHKIRDEKLREYWHSYKGTAVENDENFKSAVMSAYTQAWTDRGNLASNHEHKKYLNATPMCWRNKLKPHIVVKAMPWFQPIEENTRVDFVGMLKDVMPEFTDDVLGPLNIYKGFVMQAGWLFENEENVWFGLPMSVREQFEELGTWAEFGPKDKEPLLKLDERA